MKNDKITYDSIKIHLTEEQQEEYADPESCFKQIIDKAIRNANRTPGLISAPVLSKRSLGLQKAHSVLDSLDFEQVETLKTLPERLKKANELSWQLRDVEIKRIYDAMPIKEGFSFEPALRMLEDYSKHQFQDLL